jgi:site-specific DNA recombinase
MRAAGYRRVSMREQVDGFSLSAQETNIRQYVQSQGWEMTEIYTDAGISAKKDSNRPALNRLLQDARSGKIDVIVVDKLDRFYRHLRGLLSALDALNEASVSFVSVQERLDFTTVWGKLTLTVLGTLAEVYIDNLRQETRKGKQQRARDGLWNGNIPYGYCRGQCSDCQELNGVGYCPRVGKENLGDGTRLIPHPLESQVIQRIFAWYAAGKESDASIARRLSTYVLDEGGALPRSRGIPGRPTTGGEIQKDLVRNWLTNIFYTGVIAYYGPASDGRQHDRHPQATYPGQHQALVSPEQFVQVQELRRMRGNSPLVSKKGNRSRVYLLSGLLRCGYCGRPMRGSNARQSHYYYRDSTNVESVRSCPQQNIKAEEIEGQFLAWLRSRLEDETALKALQSMEETRQQAESRYHRAQDLYLAGQLPKSTLDLEHLRYNRLEKTLDIGQGSDTMTTLLQMQKDLHSWEELEPLNRKRLFLLAAETAYIRDSVLIGVQLTSTLLPFAGKGVCNSGPDGVRTIGA